MAADGSELVKINQLKTAITDVKSDVSPLASYPVGSVYISYTSTSPASRFGGTWQQLKSVFPYFTTNTTPGGSNTQNLTTAQLPSHTHTLKGHTIGMGGSKNSKKYVFLSGAGTSSQRLYWWADPNAPAASDDVFTLYGSYNISNSTGSGSTHNNMPSYQGLYAWRRTA